MVTAARMWTRYMNFLVAKINQDPEGYFVPYKENDHLQFVHNATPRGGDIMYFYLPEVAPLVVGDTVNWRGYTYYVTYSDYYNFGNADPLFRYALISRYDPPGVPNIWSYRWGDNWSGKILIFFGNQSSTFIDSYEIYRSFDQVNYHFLVKVKAEKFAGGDPFSDEPPPLENLWYKVRAVDIYNRYSNFTRPLFFQQQLQRFPDPLLQGTPATWTSFGVTCPNLWYSGGDNLIHMFFGGMTGAAAGYQIGHATLSTANWKNYNWGFTEDPANPVMTPGGINFMVNGVFEPYLTWNRSRFIMYHTGYDNHNGTGMDAAGIGAFTSPTLWGPWTAVSTVTPRLGLGAAGQWDDWDVFAASVYTEGADFYMWFSASDGAPQPWKIGRASAANPTDVFTKYALNPVLSPTGTDWEQSRVLFLRNVRSGTYLIGYYQGVNAAFRFQWGTCFAGSPTDAISRTPNNPDFPYFAGTEATLRIGGSLFKDPFLNRWILVYGCADFPSTVAEIRAAIMVPVMPL